MDHQAAQERFSEYLEGELTPQEQGAIAAHLAECAACRAELDSFRQTLGVLSKLQPVLPPADFVGKVQQRINRRSRGRFFGTERLLLRIPFEWLSFVIIILMLVLYILLVEGQVRVKAPPPGPKPAPTKTR